MNRRDVLRGMASIPVATLVACSEQNEGGRPADSPALRSFFTDREYQLVSEIGETIIPASDTAGAKQALVAERIDLAIAAWGDNEFRTKWREGLLTLSNSLLSRSQFDFLELPSEKKMSVLDQLDQDAINNQIPESEFYREFKATICAAYYMSEPGATEELQYEPVPGEWNACVPVEEIGRAWATSVY